VRRSVYRLRADHYHPGGHITTRLLPGSFSDFAEAATEGAREQARHDARGEPVLVQVIDATGVPCWRMGAVDPQPVGDDEVHPQRMRRMG
jgi:hypothetical protein